MKISLIGPVTPYRGGIAKFTTLLAVKLIKANHQVQVISFKKQYPTWLYPGKSDKDNSPGRLQVNAQFTLSPLDPISWRKTLKTCLDFHPEQVIFPWWITFWAPAFHYLIKRLKRRGIPISILIHNTLPHETQLWDRFLTRKTLKRADRFIVMSENEKSRLQTILPNACEIIIAPHPIYPAYDKKPPKKDAIRQRLSLPINSFIILFFGIIRPYKGLDILLQAFYRVLEKQQNAHLLVVGEFWEEKTKYLSLINSLGIADHIHIVDRYIPDEEVSAYFQAADLFAAPYVDGSQSGAVKLALGFGLPVVLTDVISDELIKSLAERCLIVPVDDAQALAEGVLQGLNRSLQSQDQVKALVESSWRSLLQGISSLDDQTFVNEHLESQTPHQTF